MPVPPTSRPRPAFTSAQIRELTNILGEGTAAALPGLEQAVHGYRRSGGQITETERRRYQALARGHAERATRLVKAIGHLRESLTDLDSLVLEASNHGFVQLQPIFLGSPGVTLGTIGLLNTKSEWVWKASRDAGEALRSLLEDAQLWRERALESAKGRRGRKMGDRPRLAMWVGMCLARAGAKRTRSSGGAWARTLRVVHEAAGVKSPEDLYPEIAAAYKALRADYEAARAAHEAAHRVL